MESKNNSNLGQAVKKDFVGGKTTWCCHLYWGKTVQSATSLTYEEGGSMVPGVGCKVTEDN